MAKELTHHQQTIWNAFLPQSEGGEGLNHQQIADRMGISKPVVAKCIGVCKKKLGFTRSLRKSWEEKNPIQFTNLLDGLSETKLDTVKDALKNAGVSDSVSDTLIKRIRVKYYGGITAVKNLKKLELDDMLGKKIHMMLGFLDDKVAGEASARDLAMGIAQLIEKQQLIRGEATVIISDLERKSMHELMPALVAEAKRRGITVEGEFKDVSGTAKP